jgi:ABC-type polar amino acid transport system ATPase subunit
VADPPRRETLNIDRDPVVVAERVRKHYGRLEVLRGIDLTVYPGQVVVIIGPSGSGKSTFLRCINHLEKIDGAASMLTAS